MERKLKVSIIQDSPVLFDLEKTMEKTIELTRKAAENGSKLVVSLRASFPAIQGA